MVKDSGLRIRVERELRQKFIELCRARDRPAAQVIREFMKDYVAEHGYSQGPPNDMHISAKLVGRMKWRPYD